MPFILGVLIGSIIIAFIVAYAILMLPFIVVGRLYETIGPWMHVLPAVLLVWGLIAKARDGDRSSSEGNMRIGCGITLIFILIILVAGYDAFELKNVAR